MVKLSDDCFRRALASAWGSTNDQGTWSLLEKGTVSLASSTPAPETLCPICVLLLASPEGEALFTRYMTIGLSVISDGQGHVSSSRIWSCAMCGATGEGQLPTFHAKP